jgi:hypothetical protein
MGRDRSAGPLVRDTDTGDLLELLLVMSVATILINRAFLAATRYPRIAFGSLHISHMLWGGFLMLIALVMVFRYWSPSIRRLAAFLSGIGFGLFIDELGKFITKDNNYFYRPTLAIIYIIFIAMFLAFRALLHGHPLSDPELAINAEIRRDISDPDPTGYDAALRMYYAARKSALAALVGFLSRPRVIPAVIISYVAASLLQFVAIFGWVNPAWVPLEDVSGLSLVGVVVSNILLLVGLADSRHSLSGAARWLRRAVLVSIFVTQIFLFYKAQLAAIWGLGADLIIYYCISTFIARHKIVQN